MFSLLSWVGKGNEERMTLLQALQSLNVERFVELSVDPSDVLAIRGCDLKDVSDERWKPFFAAVERRGGETLLLSLRYVNAVRRASIKETQLEDDKTPKKAKVRSELTQLQGKIARLEEELAKLQVAEWESVEAVNDGPN